jgi:phenylalanyl-tRNA synthetase beta chain
VPEEASVRDLEQFLRDAGKHVRDVRLFEIYRGEGMPAGKKSVNFTVVLGAEDRTLTASDEEKYIQRVRERCAELGAELRG